MNTTTIPLGKGYAATIDTADAELVAGFKWRPLIGGSNVVYAHAWHRYLHVYMHRVVFGAGPKDHVDHINGDGLDNRLSNLRIATPSQNLANRPKDTPRKGQAFSSQYKGVYWDKTRGAWMAQISHIHGRNKHRYLGRFDNEADAARAYDKAAVEEWGDFARLNLPTHA